MLVLAEGLQDVGLPGVVPVGVLKALQEPLLQHQDGDAQLVPQKLHRPDGTKTKTRTRTRTRTSKASRLDTHVES